MKSHWKYFVVFLLMATMLVGAAENKNITVRDNFESRKQAANELIGVFGLKDLMEEVLARMIDERFSHYSSEGREKLKSAAIRAIDLDSGLYLCAEVYAENFTTRELKWMVKFYQSSLGKKIMRKLPEMEMKCMEISRGMLQGNEQKFQREVNAIIKEENSRQRL